MSGFSRCRWQVVINQFSRVGVNNRCSYFGNVTLGTDVSLEELRKLYDVVRCLQPLVTFYILVRFVVAL
jgi:hypothetical protein